MQAVETPSVNVEQSNPQMAADVASEIPKALADLNAKEQKIWSHITNSLNEYQLIHLTDALALTIICKTFVSWLEAEDELAKVKASAAKSKGGKDSYMITTPNGHQQPHQSFYVARTLKQDLLKWLPEAALTIPTFQKVMGERVVPQQREMFDDPIKRQQNKKRKIGMVALNGGKK